jgi:hypothetical protein
MKKVIQCPCGSVIKVRVTMRSSGRHRSTPRPRTAWTCHESRRLRWPGRHDNGALRMTPGHSGVLAPFRTIALRPGQAARCVTAATYLIPITIESGPTSGSTRVSENPAAVIQPSQSAPV